MGASNRLAVYGDHLTCGQLTDRHHPLAEEALEALRVQHRKEPAECVMRGYAVGQVQKPAQPLSLRLAELLDVHPGVGSAHHGADGDHHDVGQAVSLGALHTMIRQDRKLV